MALNNAKSVSIDAFVVKILALADPLASEVAIVEA